MMKKWSPVILLLWGLWASRVLALDSFPLFVDEGVHITRAEEVWKGHPFWQISDGRIINHWLIAVLDPQDSPIYAGRMATVLVAMLGLAAGYALARRLAGPQAALLAGILWIASPYLFFYERMALCDAEAGGLVVVATWSALILARRGRPFDALRTGLAIAAAALFKFTAFPFAVSILLIVLFTGALPWRRRVINLLLIGGTGAACFAVPVLYQAARGSGFQGALDWLNTPASPRSGIADNVQRLWDQLVGYEAWVWTLLTLSGLALLAVLRPIFHRGAERWRDGILLLGLLIPLTAMIVLGHETWPRHYVVVLPLAFTLAGVGLGEAICWFRSRRARWGVVMAASAVLVIQIVPFARTEYREPEKLVLPKHQYHEYMTDHSAGFGLREAVEAFPQTIGTPGVPVIASMFPDSCRRADFYDTHGYHMLCPTAPGLAEINAALTQEGIVYVLAEKPPIGATAEQLGPLAVQVAAYPRPGETEQTASITLWRLERRQ